ncbi:probable MATH domain and coiled-coil domain-containing protein At3g at N-terminal half [Coccomyxa sp. Obi]|nr:probable MATH domain and coiled-coil domain-containing protein At3g at N-terminal half [Coccomyxa sp. Obi]
MLEDISGGVARLDPPGNNEADLLTVGRKQNSSATVTWKFNWNQAKQKQKCLQSKYVEVGGKDCRLLVYPFGDTQALPGYVSFYLQLQDPTTAPNNRWDCFASYKLSVVNQISSDLDLSRESWHRFSSRPARQQTRPLSSSSHGWADFASAAQIQDPKAGFLVNGFVTVSATVLVLEESVQLTRDGDGASDNLSGKFTWKVKNFELFREMIKVQKIMSPPFAAGDCSLRISVYQSPVNNSEHLSLCLESKDTESSGGADAERTCWCLFRLSVLSQKEGGKHFNRESYGRFSTDLKQTDSASLGWNDFLAMDTFTDLSQGYLQDGTAVFQAAFQGIKEFASFYRGCPIKELNFFGRQAPRRLGGPAAGKGAKGALTGPAVTDSYQATFVWRIEHFMRLKDLLKKRKITGLCVKSKRFSVGGCTCRLIVYPRGQSQPPRHLSMFLEVSDKEATSDWSCFVSHRLVIVNQRDESRSLVKESQNRYMKAAKDWGWREFVTLHTLFDADAGFLVNDDCIFAAEVLMLRETSEAKQVPVEDMMMGVTALALPPPPAEVALEESTVRGTKVRFTWRLENFAAFRTILDSRKVFSRFFAAEGCKLRLGAYTSYSTLCTYLESDSTTAAGQERNFWVKSRVAVLNQRHPERTQWKESAICTKTWNNSVLQLVQMDELMNPEAGYLVKEGLILCVEVLECCPWFEFADLEKYASDEEAGASVSDSEDSASISEASECSSSVADAAEPFWTMMGRTGLGVGPNQPPLSLEGARSLQAMLADQLKDDDEAVDAYVAGLCAYMDSPSRVKRLLLPLSGQDDDAPQRLCLLDFLCTVVPLRDSVVRLVLDKMIQCCSPQGLPTAGASAASQALPPKYCARVTEFGPLPASAVDGQEMRRAERRRRLLEAGKGAARSGTEGPDAVRKRASMPPPEGGRHLMRDTRRTESDSASCSTAVIGEEPALRPAGASRALRSAARSLTDGEQSLTAESALSAEIESVDTEPSADEASKADPAAAAVPPPFLFGKPKRMPSGQSAPGGADMESADGNALGQQDGADSLGPSEDAQARYMEGDGGVGEYPSLATDPDFNALLEDIATGPLHGGTAASGTTPATVGKTPAMPPQEAAAAPKDAAAAASGTRKILAKLKPNPLRGFLSRKLPAEKKPAAAEQPPTPSAPKPLPAETAPAAPAASEPQPPQERPHAQTERTSSGDSGQHAVQDPEKEASQADKHAAHEAENDAQLQQEEAEEVLGMAMGWLRGMYLASANSDDRECLPASVAFDHIATLLPGLPDPMKEELLLLIPSMIDVDEHISAADELLKCLTAAPDARFVLGQPLKLPAIIALSTLHPLHESLADRQRIMSVMLAVLDAASPVDKPPLLGLVLRFANLSDASYCAQAAAAACELACSCHDPVCALALSDTLRAAVLQHNKVAEAVAAQCQKRMRALEQQGTPPSGEAQPSLGGNAVRETDMCLQLLHVPTCRSAVYQAIARALSHGVLTKDELAMAAGRVCAKQLLTQTPPPSVSGAPSPPLGPCTPADSPEPKQLVEKAMEAMDGPDVPSWHSIVASHLSTAAAASDTGRESDHLLWLADKLTASSDACVRAAGSHLCITVCRMFPMEATQERLLRTLVDRALASAAAPHQPPAGSAQRPAQNARKGSGRAAAEKQADAAAAPKPSAASQAAVDVLLDLAEEPSCSRAALKLILERAGTPGRELEKLSQQLQAAQKDLEAARSAEAAARSKAAAEAKQRATQKAEAEAAAANLRSEHAAELARLAAARKKLETRCEQLEREVDWVKSERDEALNSAEATATRLKDAETAASRAKALRRDELKKEKKERSALLQRCEAAEAAKRKAEEEVGKVRATASAAVDRVEAQLRESQERLQAAEVSAKTREAEAGQLADKVKELEAQLARAQAVISQQETMFAGEKERLAPYFGHGLERLARTDLEALNSFHYKAINRLQPLLGKIPQVQDKAVDEEEEQAAAQAAAVAVALAESVAGSPPARSVCTTPPPRTPYASSGGTTPQNDRMSARGTSALRSMGSIDSASSHESVRNLAAAFSAAETHPPNGVPRSPSRYPSGPVNGGVHAHATANGGAAKDQLRASFGAAMAGRPQPANAAAAGSNAPGGKLGPVQNSPYKNHPAARGPVLNGAPSAIGPPGGKAPGQGPPGRGRQIRHQDAAPILPGSQPKRLMEGGSRDARSALRAAELAAGVPSQQLWGLYGQPQQQQQQQQQPDASTSHPLSAAFPQSLWSSGSVSNGMNGTHQMW